MGRNLKTAFLLSVVIKLLVILAPLTPAHAYVAPPEDRGWGVEDYESENARYQARVQFYQDRSALLEGRRQQIAADLNLFWRTWSAEARDGFVEQFDRSFDGIQYLSRVDVLKEDENNARGLFIDFQTNCARCDDRKPDIRERAYTKHLDYLRTRNARTAEYNRYLDLRQQRIKANAEFAFEEWMRDNIGDVTYVTDRVAGTIAEDFYKSCIEGTFLKVLSDAASLKLTGKQIASPASLLVDCVKDVGFGTLANALLFALQKQFIDDMVRRRIHKEVAEYWMFEILTPKGAGKLSGATKVGQTSAKLLAREVKAQFKHQLGQGIRTGLRAKFLENPWTVGAKPTSDAGLLKIREEAIDKLATEKQQELLQSDKIQLRMQAYDAGKFVGKYIERVLPLVAAYYDFPELERLEVPKYWQIRRCLEARRLPARGPDIVAILKRPPPDYRTFKRECREQEQAACPENIEAARTMIGEAAQVRATISREAGEDRIRAIGEAIRAYERRLQGLSDEVNRVTLETADLCAKLKREKDTLTNLLERIRNDAAKTSSLRDKARRHAWWACATLDGSEARREAVQAENAATQMKRIKTAIATVRRGLETEFEGAGETVDIGWAVTQSAEITGDIEDFQGAIVTATQRQDRAIAEIAGLESALAVCTKRADREVRGQLAQARRALTAMTIGDPGQIGDLQDGERNAQTWIDEMKVQQINSRSCLAGLPDPKGILADIRSWDDAVDLFVEAAIGDAERARECAGKTEADSAAAAAGGRQGGAAARPDAANFVIIVRGGGFIPHWSGGSWATTGENEEVFTLQRGQDLKTELKAYCERLVGNPEEMVNPPGIPGQVKRPIFWNEGPEIEVMTDKILDHGLAKQKAVLDTWAVDHESNHGPLSELKKRYKKRGCKIKDS